MLVKFSVVTLFPEALAPYLESSMLGKAGRRGIAGFELVNLRDYGLGPHRSVDDTPYGGGDGMLLRPEPAFAAIEAIRKTSPDAKVIIPVPGGELWTQRTAERFVREVMGGGPVGVASGSVPGITGGGAGKNAGGEVAEAVDDGLAVIAGGSSAKGVAEKSTVLARAGMKTVDLTGAELDKNAKICYNIENGSRTGRLDKNENDGENEVRKTVDKIARNGEDSGKEAVDKITKSVEKAGENPIDKDAEDVRNDSKRILDENAGSVGISDEKLINQSEKNMGNSGKISGQNGEVSGENGENSGENNVDLAGGDYPVHYIILCPHYEGLDARILTLADYRISLGKYILTGGELPALVIIDAIVRLLPGVLGGENSATEESFSAGDNLEYPQYTKPAEFRGMKVPEVLLSGDHGAVARWRAEHSGVFGQ